MKIKYAVSMIFAISGLLGIVTYIPEYCKPSVEKNANKLETGVKENETQSSFDIISQDTRNDENMDSIMQTGYSEITISTTSKTYETDFTKIEMGQKIYLPTDGPKFESPKIENLDNSCQEYEQATVVESENTSDHQNTSTNDKNFTPDNSDITDINKPDPTNVNPGVHVLIDNGKATVNFNNTEKEDKPKVTLKSYRSVCLLSIPDKEVLFHDNHISLNKTWNLLFNSIIRKFSKDPNTYMILFDPQFLALIIDFLNLLSQEYPDEFDFSEIKNNNGVDKKLISKRFELVKKDSTDVIPTYKVPKTQLTSSPLIDHVCEADKRDEIDLNEIVENYNLAIEELLEKNPEIDIQLLNKNIKLINQSLSNIVTLRVFFSLKPDIFCESCMDIADFKNCRQNIKIFEATEIVISSCYMHNDLMINPIAKLPWKDLASSIISETYGNKAKYLETFIE